MKHTPGPWKALHGKVYSYSGWYITRAISNGDQFIARMDASTYAPIQSAEANAHLIAAAPEMYEALKAFITMANTWHKMDDESFFAVFNQGAAAIAKAEET